MGVVGRKGGGEGSDESEKGRREHIKQSRRKQRKGYREAGCLICEHVKKPKGFASGASGYDSGTNERKRRKN